MTILKQTKLVTTPKTRRAKTAHDSTLTMPQPTANLEVHESDHQMSNTDENPTNHVPNADPNADPLAKHEIIPPTDTKPNQTSDHDDDAENANATAPSEVTPEKGGKRKADDYPADEPYCQAAAAVPPPVIHNDPSNDPSAEQHSTPADSNDEATIDANDTVVSIKNKDTEEVEGLPFPVDLTPTSLTTGQNDRICAAGGQCLSIGATLTIDNRCALCGFCTHHMCSVILKPTPKRPILSEVFNSVCFGCIVLNDFDDFVYRSEKTQLFKIKLSRYKVWQKQRSKSFSDILLLRVQDKEAEQWNSDADNNDVQSDISDEDSDDEDDESENSKDADDATDTQAELKQASIANDSDNSYFNSDLEDSAASTTKAKKAPAATDSANATAARETSADATEAEITDPQEQEDDDASHATANQRNGDTTTHEPVVVEPPPLLTKFIDVQIQLEASPSGKPIDAMLKCVERCKDWLLEVQQCEPSFRLQTVNQKAPSQRTLHDPTTFPKDLPGVKEFFKNARPLTSGGRLYLKIRASFEGTSEALLGKITWYHNDRKERVMIAPVQAYEVMLAGWLLYSTRNMDHKLLTLELTRRLKIEVSLRWMRISDGTPYDPKRDTSKDPRALHIETAAENLYPVQAGLREFYSPSAKSFPFHIRLRFVVPYQSLVNMDSFSKFEKLRNRQDGWCVQCQAQVTHDIVNLDLVDKKSGKTFRDMLMKLKSKTGNLETPLFYSIDKHWKAGGGYEFTYHPDKRKEAATIIKGIYPRLLAKYGDSIEPYFTPLGKMSGVKLTWDPKTNQVTSEGDRDMEALEKADQDMIMPEKATETVTDLENGRIVVYERDRGNDDSVTTIEGRNKKADTQTAKSTKTVESTSDNDTDTSSLTTGTTKTRLSTVENQVRDISLMIRDMMNKNDALHITMKAFQPPDPSTYSTSNNATTTSGTSPNTARDRENQRANNPNDSATQAEALNGALASG
jgi:hypothetical protein